MYKVILSQSALEFLTAKRALINPSESLFIMGRL